MLAPMVILLTIFVIVPFVNAVRLSLYNWSFYKPSEFVGLRNFVAVLTSPDFIGRSVAGCTSRSWWCRPG